MIAKFRIKLFLCICLFLTIQKVNAQCTNCSTVIASNSITSYSVTSGNTLCISPGFSYSGIIYLQGGVLCNEGSIHDLVLQAGIFNNFGQITTPPAQDETINLTGKLTINMFTGSQYNILKNLVINSATGSDSLCIVIPKGSAVDITNDLKLVTGNLRINLGAPETGTNNNGIVNSLTIHGSMSLKSGSILQIESGGFLNIAGNLTIQDSGNRSITNNGSVTLGGALDFIGNGVNLTNVVITNNSIFSASSIISSIVNAIITINNNAGYSNPMMINGSISLSHNQTTINNNGFLQVLSDISLNPGNIFNNGELKADGVQNSGVFTNNSISTIQHDFLNLNETVVSDSSYLVVNNKFTNSAILTLGKASFIKAADFDNEQPTSILSGPNDILDNFGVPNDVNYARVITDNLSKNSGIVDGYLEFTDISFNNPGIDVLDPTSVIGPFVVLAGGGRPCNNDIKMGYFTIVPNKAIYCPGENIFITFTSFMNIITMNWNYSGTSTNLYPGSHTLDIMGVQTGGVVTYSGVYFNGLQYCNFSFKITITLGSPQVTATTPVLFAIGTPVNLNSTVSNATPPITFNWQPNLYFSPPSTNQLEDPTVSPDISLVYTVTATDSYGCASTATVQVISQPYAHLNKSPDGGYYKLFDNKLLFKFDGQYAATNLKYKVFDKSNTIVASDAGTNIASSLVVNSGDNRYYLNANGASLTSGAYYTLEISNEKNEKMYLRFIR